MSASKQAIMETHLDNLVLLKRGKVRDVYDLGDSLLIVATDRISAFDVVMENPIPDKGRILTRISKFWFDRMSDIVENHVISFDADAFPELCKQHASILEGRTMWVKKARPLPIECIVRGYLAGSGWKEYRQSGALCGHVLPRGLVESGSLPEPLFTPSTKAELEEHDENITLPQAESLVGRDTFRQVERISLQLYHRARDLAWDQGIIIADTKFEFGICGGKLILIDEILTPDSSRFWPKDEYLPGGPQKSFDKQFLRDYLESLSWDKRPPAPVLPPTIIAQTRDRYVEALDRITGGAL